MTRLWRKLWDWWDAVLTWLDSDYDLEDAMCPEGECETCDSIRAEGL